MKNRKWQPSFRSQFVTARSYCRPKNEDGSIIEDEDEMYDRTIRHQKWLWETAKGKLIGLDRDELTSDELKELEDLRDVMYSGEATLAGRSLWLGGTEISKKFHATQFNCSFEAITTVHDVVDAFHLLLLGCGVGAEPVSGVLNGFAKPVEIEVIRSTRTDRGNEFNRESVYRRNGQMVWHLTVGDSGIAWAKAVGKILAMKIPVDVVILDFSEIRPGGKPLRGFGWISSGDSQISLSFLKICEICSKRADALLTKIDIIDIMNWLGSSLSSRRSAEIMIMAAEDLEADEFAAIKKDCWSKGQPQRAQSNNSLVFYHKPTKRELRGIFSQMLDSGGSEPGFLNGVSAKKRAPYFRGTNPCVVGDTLVYVADGRGSVPIKKLVDESVDVPVFCYDNNGKVVVRTMRNPRLTGHSQQIYKVELDDGSTLRVTGNHKFLLSSGEYKEVINLVHGDSLNIISKNEASFDNIIQNKNSDHDYAWIENNVGKRLSEHRMIAAFHSNLDSIDPGLVVHHKDRNSLNNSPENLEIMTREDHIALHSQDMFGDGNPMRRAKTKWSDEKWLEYSENMSKAVKEDLNGNYSGHTNDHLRSLALDLTKHLGRKFNGAEWIMMAKEFGAPQSFSDWRKSHLGDIQGLADWAAHQCGFTSTAKMHSRTVDLYEKLLDMGYHCEINEDGKNFVVIKFCEHCGKEMKVDPVRREVGVCSISCGLKMAYDQPEARAELSSKLLVAHQKLHEEKAIKQINIFNDLKLKLSRIPLKIEWENACREIGAVFSLGRNASFKSFKDLSLKAQSFNHRVVSIIEDGFEDVYNGTVDEFHNFFVGGFETTNEFGKKKTVFVNNLQCGEILLGDKSFCNLVSIDLGKFNGRFDDLENAYRLMVRANFRQTCVDLRDGILQETWHELNQFLRLLGTSPAGIVKWEYHQNPEKIRQLREWAWKYAREIAKELNLPTPKAITTIKPDGSMGKRLDTSEGIHKPLSKYIFNHILISKSSPVFKIAENAGYRWFQHPMDESSVLMNLPVAFDDIEFDSVTLPDGRVMEVNLDSAITQLERYKMWMDNYVDHNASITVSYSPDEIEEIISWLHLNWDKIVGVSFLLRADPLKTAEDLGYQYLPQQPVTKEEYDEYVRNLKPIDFSMLTGAVNSITDFTDDSCASGVCPTR